MNKSQTNNHFPACFVELPPYTEGRRAAFYLAAEEYIAETLPEDSYFFTWQLGPTVVMGRNQVAHQEVNLDFCRREGIDVIRRRSGGGAIFADEQNIMTSLITGNGPVEPLFKEYAEAVACALRQLGAPAEVSGRNDIVLTDLPQPSLKGRGISSPLRGGQEGSFPLREGQGGSSKICGNAFYQLTNRSIAHGTMLYDTNPRLMEGALHPDVSKFEKKGVKSVRSRIGLLKDYLSTIGVGMLRQRLRTLLCNRTIRLTDEDVREIEQMEQRYYEEDFTLVGTRHVASDKMLCGHNTSRPYIAHQEKILRRRIEGCGMVELHFHVEDNIIRDVKLQGDFFELGDSQMAFCIALTDIPFTPESIEKAIREHHPEQSVRGLTMEELMEVINDKKERNVSELTNS